MCGRVYVRTSAEGLIANFAFARRSHDDGLDGFSPRYNGAPSQDFPVIVREPEGPGGMFMRARWGLIPYWVKGPMRVRPPINARCEEIASKPMFRDAYRRRRALLPIDGFFEWAQVKGPSPKQPHAIAMQDGKPFALAAVWDEWKHPETGQLIRTFAVVTCRANELVGLIHDRMPVIIAPEHYPRWLGDEPDPRDLLKPYPAALMTMWPISTKVNSPRNDDPSILDPE